jgi:hypothetical protein
MLNNDLALDLEDDPFAVVMLQPQPAHKPPDEVIVRVVQDLFGGREVTHEDYRRGWPRGRGPGHPL